MQSSDCQDTISDEKLSSVPLELSPANPHRISLQHCQDFENYEAIPDTRVIAKRARKSRPTRSVRATKIALQNQEDTSHTKSAKHTIVERKYRDNIADKFDALFRVLPVQPKAQIKGYSGSITSERRMKGVECWASRKHSSTRWRKHDKNWKKSSAISAAENRILYMPCEV